MRHAVLVIVGIALAILPAHGQAGGAEQHVAALKKSLASSQASLRKYEWIETSVISLKGEEKSRKQNRCYYGADGKVQKVPMGDPPPQQQASGGGRRGGRLKKHIVENKKEEMQDYMEQAVALIHQYVPPNAERIQAAKDAGKLALTPGQGRVRLELTDYLKAGDLLAIEIDPATDSLLGLSVSTYLDKAEDQVKLEVREGALPDGTIYTAQTTLDAPAKNIRVVIENSGHRPVSQ
ncbi:MAG TPA: hypothetical protein VHJ77_19820 [Vicinamibacterales bacterium]|jgi:hypothetical protein|nr:hypothetical protein [Vicinamibacterales bacterium]